MHLCASQPYLNQEFKCQWVSIGHNRSLSHNGPFVKQVDSECKRIWLWATCVERNLDIVRKLGEHTGTTPRVACQM